MKGTKKSASKFARDAEEALTPASLATLAARIAPALCLNDPKRAIEAAATLIECARERLSMPNERAQLEADAERRDKYGFKLKGGNLSLADAFLLQQEERVWKGKRQGPYKIPREFEKALREEGLIFPRLPKGTDAIEKFYERPEGTTTNEDAEETTPKAVMALFERIAEQRRAKDRTRKAKN